jgi:hypothetical protein
MTATAPTWDEVEQAAARLQIWGFPLIFAQRVRLNFTQPADPDGPRPPTSAGAAVNTFGHQRELSSPELRVGVAPNVDTLYSVAWIDLDDGPRRLVLPDVGDRYYSVQVALADTSSPWALGRRTHGGRLPPVTLRRGALAHREGDDGIELATPHRFVMLCARILLEPGDPLDLARVHALQDAIALTAVGPAHPSSTTHGRDVALAAVDRADEIGDPSAFAQALAAVVADSDAGAVPEAVRQDLVTCERGQGAAVASGLEAGMARIDAHVRGMGETVNGWATNWRGADFEGDLLLRAAVAYSQIFINPAVEAVYPVCETDAAGEPLDASDADYEMVLDGADLPPVDFFWSLTMYHAAGLLVANDADRYSVGDRTPGLRRSDDGSIVVHVSSRRPSQAGLNWLPAPDGPFRLMLRLYGPNDGAWRPPPVRRLARDR